MGHPVGQAGARLNEYLDGLLPLLAGEAANADRETATTRGALMIPGAPRPDVYIAALGPQLLKIAGARTAGTMTWMTGPKTLAEHVGPTLRRPPPPRVVPRRGARRRGAPVSVTDDVDGARKQAAEQFVDVRPAAVVPRDARPRGLCRARGRAIIGDEATVKDRLDELRAAGVDEYVAVTVRPVAGGPGPDPSGAAPTGQLSALSGQEGPPAPSGAPVGRGRPASLRAAAPAARPACGAPRPATAATP